MKQNKIDKELDPKHILKVILFLRRNRFDNKYITQKDIMEKLPIVRSQTSIILKALKKNKLIDIKMICTTKNTGSRKMYRLNKKGRKLADNILASGLDNKEKRLLDGYKKIQYSKNKAIKKDFWSIIQLFQEYGLNENNALLSQMLRNFVSSVKRSFKYETQFTQGLLTIFQCFPSKKKALAMSGIFLIVP